MSVELVKLDQARQLLADCNDIKEAKKFHDIAEAARHYAKVQGLGLESANYATEIKIRAERKMGEILREMPKNKGTKGQLNGRDSSGGIGVDTARDDTPTLEEIGLTKAQSSRFQSVASIPELSFEQHIAETKTAKDELTSTGILQLAKTSNASQQTQVTIFSHESVEWYTPLKIIELARQVMGSIDLDPASNDEAQASIKASQYFTEKENGLIQKWHGHIWLNPPYSIVNGRSNQDTWSKKLIQEYRSGHVSEAILLVKSALGYKWFEELWDNWPVCFARQRLSFIKSNGDDDGESKQGTSLFYFGTNLEKFIS